VTGPDAAPGIDLPAAGRVRRRHSGNEFPARSAPGRQPPRQRRFPGAARREIGFEFGVTAPWMGNFTYGSASEQCADNFFQRRYPY